MTSKLANYLPKNSVEHVELILKNHPIHIKIVNKRSTKHGDFKRTKDGFTQITINNNLNCYQFLITLIHEIAHFITYKQNFKAKPHGKEWKRNFQHLMLPFIHPSIFPENILPVLANHLKNPKASSGSDAHLTFSLKQYDIKTANSLISEIAFGSLFIFKNRLFKKGNKRRTRYECLELKTNKLYLFNQFAEVILQKNSY